MLRSTFSKEVFVFTIFTLIVSILNVSICKILQNHLMFNVFELLVFIIVLYATLLSVSCFLNRLFSKYRVLVIFGAFVIKLVSVILFIFLVVMKGNNREQVALFFMGNYLLYLCYSVIRIIKFL